MKSSTSDGLAKLIVYGGLILITVAAIFGALWVIWMLWCWVLPQVYPSGPINIIAPSYWLFIGMWALLAFIGRLIFFHGNKK